MVPDRAEQEKSSGAEAAFFFLTREERELLTPHLTRRLLAAGEDLFVEGEEGGHMGFLLSGRLAVKKPTEFSGRYQVIALLDPGAIVGESGLLGESRVHGATVTAVRESCLLLLQRRDFVKLANDHPRLAITLLEHLLHIVGLRLQQTSDRLSRVL